MTAPRITSVRHGVDLVLDGGPERDRIRERLVAELDDGYLAPEPRREDTFRPVRFEIGFW